MIDNVPIFQEGFCDVAYESYLLLGMNEGGLMDAGCLANS